MRLYKATIFVNGRCKHFEIEAPNYDVAMDYFREQGEVLSVYRHIGDQYLALT